MPMGRCRLRLPPAHCVARSGEVERIAKRTTTRGRPAIRQGGNSVERNTERIMKRSIICTTLAGVALVAALMPGVAHASDESLTTGAAAGKTAQTSATKTDGQTENASEKADGALAGRRVTVAADAATDMLATCAEALGEAYDVAQEELRAQAQAQEEARAQAEAQARAQAELTDKVLEYDPADIEAIGTQEASGHTICCPSFSCAYADAILDGTVNDHSYYTCSNCTWPDWGGGGSAYRYVGTDEELLREAYDQIAAGRPTVVHVSAGYGEHWIALIGYTGADDPDALTLENFVALDPWDGAQIIAAERYSLYGDGCQHISDRA